MSIKSPIQFIQIGILVVFVISLIPSPGFQVQAEEAIRHSLDDAAALMYISEAILTDESEIDDSTSSLGLLSLAQQSSPASVGDDLLARMIHAVKMERNDLDANCRLLKTKYNQADQECEAQKTQSWCAERRAELNNRIGQLHSIRGDRRKPFTKIWHSIKRNSSNFWHKIGPVGRNFLRRMGPEVLQIVASGGTLSGGVLKNLAKHIGKSMGRERIKQVVLQGVQRLLQGQIKIAQAAGVDICDPDEGQDTDQSADSPKSSEPVDILEYAYKWSCDPKNGNYYHALQGDLAQETNPDLLVDFAEFGLNLQAGSTEVTYDLNFHGLYSIPLYSADGDLYDYLPSEEINSGKGKATWDRTYFYGSITIDHTSYLHYESGSQEHKQSNEKAVIGALSPNSEEIHLCFHEHTKDQFDSIKTQPIENLRENCLYGYFFVCTPQE